MSPIYVYKYVGIDKLISNEYNTNTYKYSEKKIIKFPQLTILDCIES